MFTAKMRITPLYPREDIDEKLMNLNTGSVVVT